MGRVPLPLAHGGEGERVAQEVSFTFVVRPEGERIAAVTAFFDHDEALRSLA